MFVCCFRVRRNAVRTRNAVSYSMEPDHTYESLPPHILKYVSVMNESLVDVPVRCLSSWCVCLCVCLTAEGGEVSSACLLPTVREHKSNSTLIPDVTSGM